MLLKGAATQIKITKKDEHRIAITWHGHFRLIEVAALYR